MLFFGIITFAVFGSAQKLEWTQAKKNQQFTKWFKKITMR